MLKWLKNLFYSAKMKVTPKQEAPSRVVTGPTGEGWAGTPDSLAEYKAMFNSAAINAYRGELDVLVNRIVKNMQTFKDGVAGTNIPWDWIAVTMTQENSVDMSKQILNGQAFNRVTTIVPKGLGPWVSWVRSTIFAIQWKKLDKITDWSIENQCQLWEKWNGMGYFKRGLRSPYVWAGTNLQQAGLYVSDGRFDSNKWKSRPGCVAVHLRLKELGHI